MSVRLLFFVIFPLLELWLLLKLGAWIGALAVFWMVIASMLIGVRVLQFAGWRTWFNSRWRLQRGQSPAPELLDGFLLAIGGVLLLLPGLISDVVGLLLLIAPLRRYFAGRFAHARTAAASQASGNAQDPVTIDGEFRREP